MAYEPLESCTSCRRHIRAAELSCPFCGAAKSFDPTKSGGHKLNSTKSTQGPRIGAVLPRMSRAAVLVASIGAISCKESATSTYAPYGAPVPRDSERTTPVGDASVDSANDTATEPDVSAEDTNPFDTAKAKPDANRPHPLPNLPVPPYGGPTLPRA